MNRLTLQLISVFTLIAFFFTFTLSPVLAAVTYLYDANGNMTSDGTKCFEYNEANQLKKVKKCSDSQTIAEYVYDHTGKRVVKKEYENGSLKRTIFSPSDEYETVKLASNGATQNTVYYKANDGVVAKKNPDGTKTFYHNDHLGSNAVLTNQSGTVVEKTSYEPYGEVKSGGIKSKFGYTGQEKDLESGLNYYDSRYYDPHLQRFIQPDSLLPDVYDPQQLNRYSYVRNNPLRYTDPTGQCIGFLTPFCGTIVSMVTKLIQPVVNLLTKIINSPTTQQVVQNVNKAQSNPVVQKAQNTVTNTASKVSNNAIVQKGVSSINSKTQAGSSIKTGINIAPKIERQMQSRGWTESSIKQTVNNPTRTVPTRDIRAIKDGGGMRIDDPATAYYADDGTYVVVNDITKDVVQIMNKNKPFWKTPWE